jgi:purine-binding chemotaxis protein CheW
MTAVQHEAGLDLLVFELAGARYALEAACVREVVRAVFITPLPDAPAVVEGVIDVRGEIVPVYDVRLRFGLPLQRLRPDEQIVLAWTGDRRVAIRCDRTDWVAGAERSRPADGAELKHAGRHIVGVARLADGIVLIHDLQGFLEQAEAEALESALAAHARERG